MVKHIVFWKVKDNAEKQKNIDCMIDMLKSLVGKIEGLISIEVGYNFNNSSDYDVVLYASFTNPSALKYYQTHPEHVKCKEFISQVTVDRACADYFFESTMASATEPTEIPVEATTAPEIAVETPVVSETPKAPEIAVETPAVPETPKAPEIAVETPAVPETPKAPEITVETPANPFGVEINTGSAQSSLPNIQTDTNSVTEDFSQQFQDVQPSVQGYNPQIKTEEQLNENTADSQTYQAPDLSFIKAQGQTASKKTKFENDLNDQADKNYAQPLEPIDFSYVPPAAPMKFNPDSSSYSFGGYSQPSASNMPLNDTPVSTPVSAPTTPKTQPKPRTRTVQPAAPQRTSATPPKTPHSKIKETTNAFGKKKIDVEVTPLEQRADVWTCPNCGKVMPNYVGTCGCGEVKPFDFGDDTPAAPMTYQPAPQQPAPQRMSTRTPAKTPQNAQVNPVSTEHSKIKETTNAFGKKKIDVEVTPLEQRADVWTCPNCGKVMPNYVGTCGCGEVKPFDFGDDTPAAPMTYQPAPQQPAPQRTATRTTRTPAKTPQNAQVNPVSTEHSKIKETTNAFGKKKIDVEVTPLEQRADVWTCPNCGKVMPNYVGTCGCGEIKPFDF